MMRAIVTTCACAVSIILPCSVAARAEGSAPPSVRHLVYNFTYGTSSDVETLVSGFGNPSGDNNAYSAASRGSTDTQGSVQDKGTITIDVIAERPDGALVLNVSEQAQKSRTAYPATCVVFNNTNTMCDPSKKINDEEIALVRLLGPHFVDPALLDAKQHWKTAISLKGFSQESDFTVTKAGGGGLMTISETTTSKQSSVPKLESTTTSTIGYDASLQVLTMLDAYTVARSQQTMESHLTQKSQVTASLASDSMAKKP